MANRSLLGLWLIAGIAALTMPMACSAARTRLFDSKADLMGSTSHQRSLKQFGGFGGFFPFFGSGPPPPPPPVPPPPPPTVVVEIPQQQQQEQQPIMQQSPPPDNQTNLNPGISVQTKDFTPVSLPTYNRVEFYTQGPVPAANILASAPSEECMTIGEVLDAIPQASMWKELLKDAGLNNILLADPKAQATIIVPVDASFSDPIDAKPMWNESTIGELIISSPDIINSLAGASVWKGLWPSDSLGTGMQIPTSNTVDKVNPLNVQIKDGKVIQSQGSAARILQSDIVACGPSVIHIVDAILLPFRFDDGPKDAVRDTKAGK